MSNNSNDQAESGSLGICSLIDYFKVRKFQRKG